MIEKCRELAATDKMHPVGDPEPCRALPDALRDGRATVVQRMGLEDEMMMVRCAFGKGGKNRPNEVRTGREGGVMLKI